MGKKIHLIMGIIMVAMLAFGGTFAYFTAEASNTTGKMITAKVSVKDVTITKIGAAGVLPKDKVVSSMTFVNESDTLTYLFYSLEVKLDGDPADASVLTVNRADGWETVTTEKGTFYYKTDVAASDEPIEVLKTGDAENTGIVFDANCHYVNGVVKENTTDYMGAEIEVTLTVYACQDKGLELQGALTALGLGTIKTT